MILKENIHGGTLTTWHCHSAATRDEDREGGGHTYLVLGHKDMVQTERRGSPSNQYRRVGTKGFGISNCTGWADFVSSMQYCRILYIVSFSISWRSCRTLYIK